MRSIVSAIWFAACVAGGCRTAGIAYRVSHVPDASVSIDGQLDEKAWQLARPLTDFRDPWRGGGLPTEFRAVRDDRNLYFAFTVEDETLRLENAWQGEKTVDNEDRVEIYFARDDGLENYYCIEIDPEGRAHDFTGSFPRKWDDRWNMPGLKTAGKVLAKGYVIEGSIPLASLQALGMRPVMPGRRWRMGLFRADLGLQGSDSVHWITWIVPHTDKPDFHTPSAFGELQFGQARPLRP